MSRRCHEAQCDIAKGLCIEDTMCERQKKHAAVKGCQRIYHLSDASKLQATAGIVHCINEDRHAYVDASFFRVMPDIALSSHVF